MKELMGQSFTAKLSCVGGAHKGAVIFSESDSPGWSGWLEVLKDASRAARLKFTFLKTIGNRHQYAITGADDAGYYAKAALGVSFNGYLGMYHNAKVENVWTLECGEDKGKLTGFWLRDQDGKPVLLHEVWHDTGTPLVPLVSGNPVLNVAKGAVAHFLPIEPRVVS